MGTTFDGVEFQRAGTIERAGSRLQFKLECPYRKGGDQYTKTGWVYLWVKEGATRAEPEVCYVGATTKRLEKRCGGQKGGFNNSDKGKKHAGKVEDYLTATLGNRIVVYAKQAKRCRILDVDDVSLVMAEETAMISKLRDRHALWNFKPKGKGKKR